MEPSIVDGQEQQCNTFIVCKYVEILTTQKGKAKWKRNEDNWNERQFLSNENKPEKGTKHINL